MSEEAAEVQAANRINLASIRHHANCVSCTALPLRNSIMLTVQPVSLVVDGVFPDQEIALSEHSLHGKT
jgi:hypothetical protein